MTEQPRIERTLVIVKPDAVQRSLIGQIISRFERKGFRIVALKMMCIDVPLAERHYIVHKGKPFYDRLIKFITSGPVVVMAVEGYSAILGVRRLLGATDPAEAAPGTIRADFGTRISSNLVHGSDSFVTARRELELFFSPLDFVARFADGEPCLESEE